MTLPEGFDLGPHSWRILLDEDGAYVDDGNHGNTSVRRKIIWLDPSLQGTPAAEVLCHELVHAMLADTDPLDETIEERVAYTIAPRLLELIRRNPRLVKHLQD